MPDTRMLAANWDFVHGKIRSSEIVSAWSCGFGGVAEGLAKMSFGNGLGVDVRLAGEELFALSYGSMIVESSVALEHPAAVLLGTVTEGGMRINGEALDPVALRKAWLGRYAKLYPEDVEPAFHEPVPAVEEKPFDAAQLVYAGEAVEHPVVCLPVFPGTNCDYDTAKAFRKAGAEVRPFVFRNLTGDEVNASIEELAGRIDESHILAFCGGFSSGDEPDGSGKFIASVINNARVGSAIEAFLQRGGLILGICNGFQALVKSGLLPYGRLGCVTPDSPTLFRNDINRHVSKMVTTEVASVRSPWLAGLHKGDRHAIAVSHGEGKFVVGEALARELFANGQVAFRYLDNPNGSYYDIEGILSPDGHILGKMGHTERYEEELFKNISGNRLQPLFDNAVKYFNKR
jgi:phosphoribosylformylglycinamidine synthase